MYSPQFAVQTNLQENERIIREYPFATVVYVENGEPQGFHLPLLLEEKTLIGHMAKANPAWKSLNGTCALFIFHGPHQYISPEYYGKEGNVPTWNYVSVQVRGLVSVREDEAFLKKAILELSQQQDPGFEIEKNISDHRKLFASIVGIEVQITEVFGKFKLAQSKPVDERENLLKVLEDLNPALAEETKKTLK